ncbi:hypothetical protein MATR_30900 [Marivirga tractuosa]|uniref:Uncharacterized protein n=1 Tax=Marivirga tractuosa (strain ATCC 23168 / DSM 4126 / NBRC 15989 / NCIMB 1408 / VKM B-1430 / H-43) TaxID=643867 RepID=E4TU39_MARTH|nr:hypothetical protein [Marivirga tractuosa]ADR23061.1 hypothetical protein Ftrac_3086 [Marivirga tractuosa DSM 4126]BDD16265.1 hypothetical protein MATR_30900 [Marivirga tractuosa]
MSSVRSDAVLYFDFHFKLANNPNDIIAFLNQFENAEINQSEFYGKVKFQTIMDILNQNKQLAGKEEAFQKELDGMFNEIKLEICRRLRVLLAFEALTGTPKEDWQKLKVFNSMLLDLKQQGLFEMIKNLMNENNINLGKRFALEEKYKPFTPNLNGKISQNHIKTQLKSDHENIKCSFDIWLNSLEFEKVFKNKNEDKQKIETKELPEELIYEKIVPKIIDGNSLNFNTDNHNKDKYQEIFNLKNYYLNREAK